MKRMICLILALALVLTMAACGSKEVPVVTTATEATVEIDEAVAPETTEATEPETTEPTMDLPALVSDENVTFTVDAVSNNAMAGMELEVTCVNKTQETLVFSWNNVSVCGLMYDPAWAVTVPAGETMTSRVEIDTYALETMGIRSVDEITFRLDVVSSENWMDAPYVAEYFTIYPTGLTADVVVFPVRDTLESEEVLVNDENMTFIIEYVEPQEQSYVVRCYIENKTDGTLMANWENVTVNGEEVDPFWTVLVAPGKGAYAQVVFNQSDLQTVGVETVEQIDFDLLAYRYDDWSELVVITATYLPQEMVALG